MARNKNLPYIAGALLIGLALVAIALSPTLTNSLVGFSTISVSQASINNQNTVLFTASIDGGAEKGQIRLNDGLNTEFERIGLAGEDVYLEVEMVNQSCNYQINYFDEVLKQPGFSVAGSSGDIATSCPGVGVRAYCYGSGSSCYTQLDAPIKQKAYISSVPNIDYKIIVRLKRGTEVIEKIITPSNSEAQIAGIGYIKWVGSLQGNQACGSPTNVVLLRDLNKQNWQEVPYAPYYQALEQAYSSWLVCPKVGQCGKCISSSGSSGEARRECTILNNADAIIGTFNSRYADVVAHLTGNYSNFYKVTPAVNVVNPVLQFQLNASYFGVIIPREGRARIIEIKADALVETNVTKISLKLQNNGTVTESFDTSITCDKPITITPVRISLAAGETGTATLYAEGFAGTYSCIAKAIPVNSPKNLDSFAFNLEISRRVCPAEFQCCMSSIAYLDKACLNKYQNMTESRIQPNGDYYYSTWLEIRYFGCQSFECIPIRTEEVFGSRSTLIVPAPTVAPTAMPVVITPLPTPTPVPSPTEVVIPVNPTVNPAGLPPTINITKGVDTNIVIVLVGILVTVIGGYLLFGSKFR